jgi:hypothetical protein
MLVAILVGVVVLLFTTVIQAIASGATVQVATSMMRRGWAGAGFWGSVAVMLAITLIALLGIILQITVWAFVVFELDKFKQFSGAFYYSASNFTTLGLDAIQFDDHWRLLAPLEAVNGVLMFGVTTAMMFTMMGRLTSLRTEI